jgi:sugar phosphate isomerase/epimerase
MQFPSKFTVISDEVSQDLPDIVRFVKEFNLPGIELRSMFGRAFKDLTAADIAEVKRVAQGEGWEVFGCASPVFKCDIDDSAAIRAHVDEFKRSLAVAHELGAGIVRVFTFLRRSPEENTRAHARIVAHLQELRAAAAGSRVTIGVENEASCMIGTAAECAAILRLLPEPQFGIVWDPCNVLYVPAPVVAATADFRAIAPRVAHIHVKDAVRTAAKGGHLPAIAKPVATGDVGWRDHLAEVASSGYTGMFSLETHWRVIQIAEADLHLPAGYGFSRGGEEASRVCLHNLRELLPAS